MAAVAHSDQQHHRPAPCLSSPAQQQSHHNNHAHAHAHPSLQPHFDYQPIMHTTTAAAADFAAHLQMPHIPLPLETPLPPSSYDFTSQGAFHIPHAIHGPQAHPLFEGVMAMHHALGHEINYNWSDMSSCSQQQSSFDYSTQHDQQQQQQQQQQQTSPYNCEPATSVATHTAAADTSSYGQWSPPPGSILDSTPSPIEYSHPSTPEQHQHQPEPLIESPVSEDFPSAIVQPPSQASSFAIFPLAVSGTKTHEHTIAFQPDRTRTEKGSSKLDPHAADFIREKLGDLRWTIFASRLAERRTTTQKPKRNDAPLTTASSKPLDAFSGDKSAGASALDFLVKVEVVKSVLRTYVPHPYNPLKTLSHTYAPAPSGQVTLSRSTILSLSGWSNTQFSYWARRSEAISVLAPHDTRLRTVAVALERRLHAAGLFEPDSRPASPSSSTHDGSASPMYDYDGLTRELGMEPDDWVRTYVTGKGLDVIIDEVKKRSGVSPFLRGKHSSLDPFGAVGNNSHGGGSSGGGGGGGGNCGDGGGGDGAEGANEDGRHAVVYMPTFQAEKYVHEVPEVDPHVGASVNASAMAGMVSASAAARAGKRKASSPPPREGSESTDESAWVSVSMASGGSVGEVSASGEEYGATAAAGEGSRPHSLSPPLLYPEEAFASHRPSLSVGMGAGTPAPPSPVEAQSQVQYVQDLDISSYNHPYPHSHPPHPHSHPHSHSHSHPHPHSHSHPPSHHFSHSHPHAHPQSQPHPHPMALSDPSSFARGMAGKKRRLAPAPAPPLAHVPSMPMLEPPRLYSNHLETG